MRVVIPDDYQDCLHTLECFAALRGHEVVRHRQPARDEAHFGALLASADAVVAVREDTLAFQLLFSADLCSKALPTKHGYVIHRSGRDG